MGTLGLSSHKVEKEFEEGIEKLEAMHQELTDVLKKEMATHKLPICMPHWSPAAQPVFTTQVFTCVYPPQIPPNWSKKSPSKLRDY